MRELVTAMATKMKVMVMVTTQKAVAVLTHGKSKVRSCLQRVSIHIKAEEYEMETYQHCQGHRSNSQIVHTETLHIVVDAEDSRSSL